MQTDPVMDEKRKLTVADIPDDLMKQMQFEFDRDARIRQLRTQQQLAMREGKIPQAMEIGKTVNFLWERVLMGYVDEANNEADNINIESIGLSHEQKERINTLVITMFMCCDIIDSIIMDVNDVIKKKDDTLQFEQFDEVKELAKMVKGKLAILGKQTKFLKSNDWGNIVDNMYQMMYNKAGNIIRRKRERDRLGTA